MNIANIISFFVAACAFAYGAVKLFKKGKPMYFQLLICAAGCYALEELSTIVNYLCGGFEEPVTIGLLGIFGCNFFLLSANYGQLDRIVDDGSSVNNRAKRIALIAPFIFILITAAIFLSRMRENIFSAVVFSFIMLPAIPASYFNLKHLIMPIDDFGFLRSTNPCNISALIFYLLMAVHILFMSSETEFDITSILLSLSVLNTVICSEKGAKKWGI